MSVYKMSNAQMMKFVELYRDQECLWKINSDAYKNRDVRDEAFQAISNAMNIDGFGIREVAQKIKNIRSSYYQEIKKSNNSKKSGSSAEDIYKPRVPWFTTVHSFLKKNPEMSETVSNLDSNVGSGTTSEVDETSSRATVIDDCPASTASQETVTDESFKIPPSHQANSSKRRRLQERSTPPAYITQAIEKLDSIQSKLSTETEFDVWCRSLAKQLNSMETWRALDLQIKIQTLVSRERIEYEKSRSCFPPRNGSNSVPPPYQPLSQYNFEPATSESYSPAFTELQPTTRKDLQLHGNCWVPSERNPEDDSMDSFISSIHSPASDSV